MANQFQNWTQDQLVEEAQTGMRGQGALTEVMCRLKDSTVEQQQATNRLTQRLVRLTRWLIVLTVAILSLTAIQAVPLFRETFP